MEQKPLELIKTLQKENFELKKHNSRLEYQIQEMLNSINQKDQKLAKLEMRIHDLEYEIREFKSERRQMNRKFYQNISGDIVDLDSDDENLDEGSDNPRLLEPLLSQKNENSSFSCKDCNRSFKSAKNLKIHARHCKKTKETGSKTGFPKQKKIICETKNCKYSTSSINSFEKHKMMHERKIQRCNFFNCDYKTIHKKRFDRHLQSKHGVYAADDVNSEDDRHCGKEDEDDENNFIYYNANHKKRTSTPCSFVNEN